LGLGVVKEKEGVAKKKRKKSKDGKKRMIRGDEERGQRGEGEGSPQFRDQRNARKRN